ncbi:MULTISPECIES: hypothetical protein [unclassified Clostridium]|nr:MULTISPECIES: hypothetical protein [unclassified Clostridium]
MAKEGMIRPDGNGLHKKNDVRNVPQEIQGKAKSGKKKASPIE